MYWLFNRKAFKNFEGNANETINWNQKRNFRGAVNDTIIFYQEDKDGFRFTHSYKITSIIESESEKKEVEKAEQTIQLELTLLSEYGESKPFYQYMYSFPRVKSYTRNLYRHFKNKYYRLSIPEFNAIDKDRIFVSRTIVGVSLNAMHLDHRHAFLEYLVQEYPKFLSGKTDYTILFDLIQNYLSFSIIEPSHQLMTGLNDASVFIQADILNSLTFADDEQKLQDSIPGQVSVIRESIEAYESALAELTVLKSDERIFQKIFTNSGLPIDL